MRKSPSHRGRVAILSRPAEQVAALRDGESARGKDGISRRIAGGDELEHQIKRMFSVCADSDK